MGFTNFTVVKSAFAHSSKLAEGIEELMNVNNTLGYERVTKGINRLVNAYNRIQKTHSQQKLLV